MAKLTPSRNFLRRFTRCLRCLSTPLLIYKYNLFSYFYYTNPNLQEHQSSLFYFPTIPLTFHHSQLHYLSIHTPNQTVCPRLHIYNFSATNHSSSNRLQTISSVTTPTPCQTQKPTERKSLPWPKHWMDNAVSIIHSRVENVNR